MVIRFILQEYWFHFQKDLRPHFSFSYRFRPSTLQRRKRSPKTEPFENAFKSGAIWKRRFLKLLFSNVDEESDDIWKRWHHQNRHDWAPDHSTLSIQNGEQTLPCGFSLDRRCSVDGRKRYENESVDANLFENGAKLLRFCLKTD